VGRDPDAVMACCGDVPTLETLAAVSVSERARAGPFRSRRERLGLDEAPAAGEHPHGLADDAFDALFTTDRPDRLRLPRLPVADPPPDLQAPEHANLHVRGYKENGTTTTPFDMAVLNDLDRFHLAHDVARPRAGQEARSRAGRSRPFATSW
jgi:xylulose-5-phosphate/fructose-6-phosphate phosphoketolase